MSARSSLIRGILRANRGRTRLMVAAVAVGVGAAGGILGAYTVIDRTIEDSFASYLPRGRNPDLRLRRQCRRRARPHGPRRHGGGAAPGSHGATGFRRRAGSPSRSWRFTQFDAWGINRAFPDQGQWPPTDGQIVVERASLQVVDVEVGDTVEITSAGGGAPLKVVGLAHDPGRTPARMTGQVIGYVTPATLDQVGIGDALKQLALRTADGTSPRSKSCDCRRCRRTVRAARLRHDGISVFRYPANTLLRG